MRCKNCGWENPDVNVRCEKCNSPLGGAVNDPVSVKYQSTAGFEAKKTLAGCSKCGYPLRPADLRCPNCDNPVAGSGTNLSPGGGTVIEDLKIPGKPQEGKKLVGFLVSYSLNPLGEFFPVFEGRNCVGRDSSANICIPGDSLISGKHFSILYRAAEKTFKFKDELSSNGTAVNGNVSDEGELKNFDVIRIGSTRLLFIAIPAF
jgi:RNase P subunit RPR2